MECLTKKNFIIAFQIILCIIYCFGEHYLCYGCHICFFDTDDYMRAVRIREFFQYFDLSNNVIARSNVPLGCSLHWTRFYDFFLIIPSYILSFFTDSISAAIEYVCFFMGPILKSCCIFVLFRIANSICPRHEVIVITTIFFVYFNFYMIGALGKPDHHTFIMLFVLLFIDAAVLAIRYRFSRPGDYVRMALISALCIWISPETLIPLVLMDVLLFFLTFLGLGNLKMLLLKNTMIAFLVGLIIMDAVHSNVGVFSILMILLLVSMLYFIEYDEIFLKFASLDRLVHLAFLAIPILLLALIPFTPEICAVEYDKISAVHFALYLSASVFFWLCLSSQQRLKSSKIFHFFFGKIIFLTVAAIFLLTYPKFFSGMEADISDYTRKIWLSKVSEMKSPFSCELAGCFSIHLLYTILMVIYKIRQLGTGPEQFLVAQCFRSRTSLIWWIFLLNAICYTIFATMANRMIPYSMLFSLPLYVDFCMNYISKKSSGTGVRLAAAFLVTMGPLIVLNFIYDILDPPKSLPDKPKYTKQELWKALDRLSDAPVVIMASTSYGPELLYYTKHSVVAAPYHRQSEGIARFYKTMMDAFDENTVKKILIDTNTSYIFLKKSTSVKNTLNDGSSQNLSSMIISNNLPKWISSVEIPKKFDDIIVVKVNKELLKTDF
ncbi:MAG: hypothetical protein LBT70_02885 [Holosporaceae bacterium]|nr:hypothetical protein [Holosporaceae bacterium]